MRKSMYTIIIVVAVLFATIMLSGCDKTQKPPTIEEGEFPFHFTYELNGETYDIEDIVVCKWSGFDHSAWLAKPRTWDEHLKSGTNRISILSGVIVPSVTNPERINNRIEVYLDYGTGDYYMGENMSGRTRNKPMISYIEEYSESPNVTHIESTPLTDKQCEEYFGIKIIEFTFSQPIKNIFK